MKQNTIILVLFILISIAVSFIGCNTKNTVEPENQNDEYENPFNFVGVNHNLLLNNFHNNYPHLNKNEKLGLLSIGTYNEITSITKSFLTDSLGVVESVIDVELEEIYNLFEEAGLWVVINGEVYLENFMTYDKITLLLEKAIEKGLLQANVEELFPSIEATFNGTSLNNIKLMIDSLPKESYDPEIMEPALSAIAVFENSYEYWIGYNSEDRIDGTGATIIADMIGGLIGGASGIGWPGSVIGAGMFSYIYHEVFVAEH